jgi:1,2-diacylglycerol 3-alpha-glucosyltransferase
MRVLITTDSYYPQVNGASYFGQRLAAGLRHLGHTVLVVAPSTSVRSGYTTVAGVEVFGVSSAPVFFYKGMRVAVPTNLERTTGKVIREFRPDIVHAQGHFTVSKAVIKNARRAGVPVVATNHFMPENLTHYTHLPARTEIRLQRWLWGQFREVYESAERVTTPTRTAANLMKKNGFTGEIQVVSNGIDLDRFNPRQAQPGLRERYSLPEVPLLLYVGRLDKEKNLDLVLRALARVPEEVPIHFALAGRGARRPELERLVADLHLADRVTFLGFVPDEDMPALYCAAHCFVMAGTAELQSIATMEAMASGLPVLAVDAVALPELVHDGENGFLFGRGDGSMLSEQMRALFSDHELHRSMSRESLRIIQKHAVDQAMDEFEALYDSVTTGEPLAQKHPRAVRARGLVHSAVR